MGIRDVTYLSIALRLTAAVLLGGMMGIEREKKSRPAGLRTYMLVCMGACLIMLTNQFIYQATGAGDPMRLGAQVISGIGFLGAGTIIVTKRNQIKGLTTAAGLWAAAGIGLALGIGFYEAAFAAAVAIVLILSVLHRWDAKMRRRARRIELYIEYGEGLTLGRIMRTLRAMDIGIDDVQVENNSTSDYATRGVILSLKFKKRRDHRAFLRELEAIEGIVYLEEL